MRHLARTGCGVLPLMRYIADFADDIGKSLQPSVRPEWRRRRCIEGPVVVPRYTALACGTRHERVVRASSRSEEHTSELQSLMRLSYAVFCLNNKLYYNVRPATCNYRRTSTKTSH